MRQRRAPGTARLGRTTSICPRCRRLLDAELIERGGRVVLARACPEHGRFEAVVYGDAERYLEIQRFDKPGEEPLRRQTEESRGCPHDCGICPAHAQHTCLGIIEVNTACNLDCPICFADSGTGHQEHGFSLSLEQVGIDARRLRRRRGRAGVGAALRRRALDPPADPRDAARRPRPWHPPGDAEHERHQARPRSPTSPPPWPRSASTSTCSSTASTSRRRSRSAAASLIEEKLRALERCAEAGVSVSLAAAVERDLNEHEVGRIVSFGVEHPAVTGVFFQPVTHSGRFRADADPLDKLTNSDVIEAGRRAAPGLVSRR